MKVVTTLSNPFNSMDSLYFPSAQLSSVMFIAITIHSPSMTVKKKIVMRSHLLLKWLKESAKNLPLLSIKWVKQNSFTSSLLYKLTNISSFCIRSKSISHITGVADIFTDLWNIKSVLVTNLFWITWSPSVRRRRVSFCSTVKSYTSLYNNKILSLKINNLGWICT